MENLKNIKLHESHRNPIFAAIFADDASVTVCDIANNNPAWKYQNPDVQYYYRAAHRFPKDSVEFIRGIGVAMKRLDITKFGAIELHSRMMAKVAQ